MIFFSSYHRSASFWRDLTFNILDVLEAEGIYILREAAAQFKRPVILFSGGKDSLVLLRLAEKAFRPDPFPCPVLHIDTGHNFPETLQFRDRTIARLQENLIVRGVADSIREGRCDEESGPFPSRNVLQTRTLLDTLTEFQFDAAIGGARRDEEKARAKERIFSMRGADGGWNPEAQHPELWRLYNGRLKEGETMRIFPLSNWTEADIWNYIKRERLEVPSLYFAHMRECFWKEGVLCPAGPWTGPGESGQIQNMKVRFRTVGDMTCSAPLLSEARDIEAVLAENGGSTNSERAGRTDDKRSRWSMEERKREGYF